MNDIEFETIEKRYDELLERLVKGGEFLENPLIKPEMYEAGMKKFNRLWDEMMVVRRIYFDHVLRRNGHEK